MFVGNWRDGVNVAEAARLCAHAMDRGGGVHRALGDCVRHLHCLPLVLVACWTLLACESTDSSAGGGDQGGGDGAEPETTLPDPGCEGPLGAPVDPETLPACCPEHGRAHCVADVPDELESTAAACDGGGFCVPDVFIETGGVFTPQACDSLGGPGVCLSLCIPLVAENAPLLPQDVCASDEKCVPCISPLDGLETGACAIGFSCDAGTPDGPPSAPPCDDPATCAYDLDTTCAGQPAADPALFPACPASLCGGGGHCVPSTLVPADQAELLADCDASSKCVPDALIETGGLFTPPSCDSVGGFEGRCLSTCLPDVAAQIDLLPSEGCAASERCVPCFDPISGDDTGACTLSCDAGPVEPAQTFPKCCAEKGGGTCIPAATVGAESAAQLDAEECEEDLGQPGSVCVPDAIYAAHSSGELYQPSPCETGFLTQLAGASEEGACLPECIPEVDGTFGLSQTDCEDGFKCVPCIDQNGDDTGACQPQ